MEGDTQRKMVGLKDRFIASMVLAGVGDALGYNNGSWEFNYNGMQSRGMIALKRIKTHLFREEWTTIHKEFTRFGGLNAIDISDMRVSDDQVMHIATAKALVANPPDLPDLYQLLSKCYIECFKDMAGRAPGPTTSIAISNMERGTPYHKIDKAGGGCGGSMRAMCIGLRFYGQDQRDKLIAVGIESGRMTHNHPTGFFGSLVSALFTAFAVEGVPVVEWGQRMVKDILPQAYSYLKENGRDWDNYQKGLSFFEESWVKYLKLREIWDEGKTHPVFPKDYDVSARDKYYNSISFSGWGGASGHDSVIIAYDALLGAQDNFNELVLRGVLHGGDNDSTGCIACAWWGAIYGWNNVPKNIYEKVEYRNVAEKYAIELYNIRNH